MGQGARPRTGARVAAVQALFQAEASGDNPEAVIDQFVRHRIGVMPGAGGAMEAVFEDGQVPAADVPLFAKIVRGAARDSETIDAQIAAHLSRDWALDRLDPVLRALLRAAAAELWGGQDPPARVVINEYMDVAHGFFDAEEPRFANGVLNALARHMRAGEFAAEDGPRA
ncbi:transcription antitermination factor NusB [Roseomonas sp. CCTCC AB2023176]|uniref:transcription antitermination factor NusB n=1 Tax=Roseomonas sp. CCTCC AB2023176 TaxID=3342640 RepID=UPI0035DB42CC